MKRAGYVSLRYRDDRSIWPLGRNGTTKGDETAKVPSRRSLWTRALREGKS